MSVFADDNQLIIGNIIVPVGKTILPKVEIDKLFTTVIVPNIESQLTIPLTEADKILIDKGYLLPGQTIMDLPDKVK